MSTSHKESSDVEHLLLWSHEEVTNIAPTCRASRKRKPNLIEKAFQHLRFGAYV